MISIEHGCFLCALLIIYITYRYLQVFSYWKSRGILGPKPLPIFGNTLFSILRAQPYIDLEWYQKFGKIFGLYRFAKPALSIAEPKLIKQILVKEFHTFRNRPSFPITHKIISKILSNSRYEEWKRIRAIASPTFTSGKMRKLFALINNCCNNFVNYLEDFIQHNSEVELKQLMGNFTMDVIARCAFATKTNTYTNPDNLFIKKANNIFHVSLFKILVLSVLPKPIAHMQWLRRLITSAQKDSEFFIEFTRSLIKHRKENNEKHNDFLQLLIDVEKSDDSLKGENRDVNEGHHLNEGVDELKADLEAFSNVLEKKLTEDEILAQCLEFFGAGYETTATTLSYCVYELALHPDIQQLLYEEIIQTCDIKGGIDYELLSKLPLLDAVISETLRKYPPSYRLEREAMEDIVLADSDLKIEKGVVVEIPVYSIHHDSDNYPEPEIFNPNRFLRENRQNIKSYTYLPFGAGPRNCIGMRFALLQVKLGLAQVLQKFIFKRVDSTDVPVKFSKGNANLVLLANQLRVGVSKRCVEMNSKLN